MKKKTYISLIIVLLFGYKALRDHKTNNVLDEKDNISNIQKAELPSKKVLVVSAVEENDNLFERHSELRAKALLSIKERETLDTYLSNSKSVRKAYLTLISDDFEDIDSSIDRRISATNFLMDGLQRKHIDRSEIIKTVEMFLLSTKEDEINDLNIRRAIIGDKVDLYNALFNYAPEELERFKRNYLSKRLQKVIKYVEINNKRNRG